MKFKAFIFDLDGTLTDSLQDLANSVNYMLEKQGLKQLSLEEVRVGVGHGIHRLIEYTLPPQLKNNQKAIGTSLELMANHYSQTWKTNACLYPDIAETLDILMIKKIPMAIISNKPQVFLTEFIEFLLNKWDFDTVIGGGGDYHLKPDPSSTLAIIQKFGLSHHEIAFVGDGDTDIKTAIAAGIQPIAVTWGLRSVEELKAVGAKIFIDSPKELLNFI